MTHHTLTPSWLDRGMYPFTPHFFETAWGKMHYLDEGEGPPVVLVHGTPTWSFLWRQLIAALSHSHRVIAVDHLGFGLSDKPADAPYRPEDHARRLGALLDSLALQDITLIVHDFGGPIGLSYAICEPDKVRALVLFNTWMWSRMDDAATVRASRLLGGRLGRFLYTRLNLSPRVLLPMLYGERSHLTPDIHRHYLSPFPDAKSRMALWTLAGELIGSSPWYDTLWAKRQLLAEKPTLMLWGEKDAAFGMADLRRWREVLLHAEVHTFVRAGHFVPEEEPSAAERVAGFLGKLEHPVIRGL